MVMFFIYCHLHITWNKLYLPNRWKTIYDGGFLKWWYPTTMAFPTKNDHFEVCKWGFSHHLREHRNMNDLDCLMIDQACIYCIYRACRARSWWTSSISEFFWGRSFGSNEKLPPLEDVALKSCTKSWNYHDSVAFSGTPNNGTPLW